jgi:hypothetical protein
MSREMKGLIITKHEHMVSNSTHPTHTHANYESHRTRKSKSGCGNTSLSTVLKTKEGEAKAWKKWLTLSYLLLNEGNN